MYDFENYLFYFDHVLSVSDGVRYDDVEYLDVEGADAAFDDADVAIFGGGKFHADLGSFVDVT